MVGSVRKNQLLRSIWKVSTTLEGDFEYICFHILQLPLNTSCILLTGTYSKTAGVSFVKQHETEVVVAPWGYQVVSVLST